MASRNNLFLDTPRSTGLSRERGSDRESHSIINDYLSDNSSVPTTYFAAMLPVEEIVQARLRKQTSLGDFVSNFDYFSSMKCRLNGVRETDYWPADTDETTYNIEIQVGQWVSEGRVSAERRNAIDERDVAKRQGAEGTHNTHTPELHQRPKHMSRDGKIQQGRSVSPPIIIDKRFRKARTILPIIIDKHTLNSKPDSGSEENIMAFDLTARLGLNIEDNEEHRREFRIANGNVVKALGRVHALCAFAKDRGVAVVASFYVFRTLVSGIIMGMDFLDLTQTLTKYKYRLDKQIVPQHGICQISALNNPRRRLRCTATGKAMLANADTGAEMDLISRKYAQLRELKCHKLEAGETQVQLADGSVTYLGGKVFLDIKLRTDRGVTGAFYSEALERPFYILAGLTSPLLLGEETLEYMDVFEKYHDSLILETVEESCLDKPEVCTILWSDTADKFFSSGTNAPPPLSGRSLVLYAVHILEGIGQYLHNRR